MPEASPADCNGTPDPNVPVLMRCVGCVAYSDEPLVTCSASPSGWHYMEPVVDNRDCDDARQLDAPTPDTREILARVAEIEGRVALTPWETDEALCGRCGNSVVVRDGCEWENGEDVCDPCAARLVTNYRRGLADLCRIVRGLVGGAS